LTNRCSPISIYEYTANLIGLFLRISLGSCWLFGGALAAKDSPLRSSAESVKLLPPLTRPDVAARFAFARRSVPACNCRFALNV
jgi:hypothetical protein